MFATAGEGSSGGKQAPEPRVAIWVCRLLRGHCGLLVRVRQQERQAAEQAKQAAAGRRTQDGAAETKGDDGGAGGDSSGSSGSSDEDGDGDGVEAQLQAITARCRAAGAKYVDEEFPAGPESLVPNPTAREQKTRALVRRDALASA